jgi:hypothetical protein
MPIVGLCDGEGGWIHGRALFMSDFEEACVLEEGRETPSENLWVGAWRRCFGEMGFRRLGWILG